MISTPVIAETIDIGSEQITLKSLNAAKPAIFPHRAHQRKFVCMQCHHVDGNKMEIGKCHSCHNENLGEDKLDTMKEIGHALCKECHKKQREAGIDVPGKFSTCHPLIIRKTLPSYAR